MKFDFLKKINWTIVAYVFVGMFIVGAAVGIMCSGEGDPEIIQIEVPQTNVDSINQSWNEIIENTDSVNVFNKIKL